MSNIAIETTEVALMDDDFDFAYLKRLLEKPCMANNSRGPDAPMDQDGTMSPQERREALDTYLAWWYLAGAVDFGKKVMSWRPSEGRSQHTWRSLECVLRLIARQMRPESRQLWLTLRLRDLDAGDAINESFGNQTYTMIDRQLLVN